MEKCMVEGSPTGTANGAHLQGVARAISSRLRSAVVEITVVDERIMRLKLKHTFGFMSLVAVYARKWVCEMEEKEMSYAKLESTLYL